MWGMMIRGNESVVWLQVLHVCTSCAKRDGAQPFLQTGLNSRSEFAECSLLSLLVVVQAFRWLPFHPDLH